MSLDLPLSCVFSLMIRRPPRSTRTDTLFPYTTLFRSADLLQRALVLRGAFQHADQPLVQDVEAGDHGCPGARDDRSEEHTSELQSLMRISYAVFCLKKKKIKQNSKNTNIHNNNKEKSAKTKSSKHTTQERKYTNI